MKYITNLIVGVMSIFILLLGLELYLRIYYRFKYREPFWGRTDNFLLKERDPKLGWKGMEIMGDPQSKKMKIFFVGDSFTTRYLNDGEMYYDVVKKNMDIELSVCAAGGYGTLQEYLMIDKYIDKVKPDLVVLQTCSNDFIGNNWNLERRVFLHNDRKIRPYYENGRIKYRIPRGPYFIRRYIVPYSRLACEIFDRVDKKLANLAKNGRLKMLTYINPNELGFEEFEHSIDTTSELIGMIKERCGEIPLIAFHVSDDEPYFGWFGSIFHNHAVDFLEGLPKLAWDTEGTRWGPGDPAAHWTKKGHAVCGEYLANYIKTNFRGGKVIDRVRVKW